jgi:hypothetical protein
LNKSSLGVGIITVITRRILKLYVTNKLTEERNGILKLYVIILEGKKGEKINLA